jgi:opacity protein-like surface antigen
MKIYQGLLAGCVLGLVCNIPAVSAADPYAPEDFSDFGLYLSVAGGWNYADSDNFDVPSVPVGGEIFFEDGWTGAIALGAHVSDHIRTELEFAVRHNALDDEDIVGLGTIDLNGDVNVYTGLAKVAYDFGDGPFRPFLGIGIGFASFDVDINAPVAGNDSDMAVAGSLEAGINYSLTEKAELFADTEVLLLEDVTLDPTSTGSATLSNPMFVSASVGFRWKF